eukprot:580666_1
MVASSCTAHLFLIMVFHSHVICVVNAAKPTVPPSLMPTVSPIAMANKGVTFDFSLLIMWAYFIAYCIMFLVVSIVCAINIHKEKEPKANIFKLIKAWGKSLWHKKKIYGELLPHFFDQATDFGVVYEFGQYYAEDQRDENSGKEVTRGVNTQYLFYISIAIIVVHRIVSSVAVYNLTHKPKYALYQFLDVLMIRCVYTNYKLDTNQPSNAQRYLQTMEAIFESAPQILISTAFLIKTKQGAISATVIVSLITSLFSLSRRVSADDKVMLQDDWKEIKHRNADGKWKFPFVNWKYIVRVVFWRFLEISSRITLLVLTWVNLGGKAIFFLLAIEFCYLSVLAWALGTIDIMGNLIYLMAANSKRKGYRWAVPMAWIFWGWRVLSGWALLISITVFAASDVDHAALLNNEDNATRYEQTFKNTAGLVLFVYCWVATPLWQWIGAVVIFDFKNLASVGRDVETLLEDGKWDEVLELVSFGAQFNPAFVLQKIERQVTIDVGMMTAGGGTAVEAGAEPDEEALEEEHKEEAPKERNCPGSHGLTEFATQSDGYRCDICGSKKREGDVMFGCRECNYDVCGKCNGKEGAIDIVTCSKGHELRHKATGYAGGYICNECRSTSSDKVAMHCDECQYDLCDTCYDAKAEQKKSGAKPIDKKSIDKLEDTHHVKPIDKLAILCKDQLREEKEEQDDKWTRAVQVCELICSCGTIMLGIALGFLGFGIYNATKPNGTEGDAFFISIGPILGAVVMLCCAISCFFDLFEKCNDCVKNKHQMEVALQKQKKINCPGKHGLKKFETENDGFGCDLCSKKVSRGTPLFGCRECNFDVCLDCKPEASIDDEEPKPKRRRGHTNASEVEMVTCAKKHPLLDKQFGAFVCSKCKENREDVKGQHHVCQKCDYHMCLQCFEAAQKSQATKVISWMKSREIDDDYPIFFGGAVCWGIVITLAFLVGSDIAALAVNDKYDCNMDGGSEYVSFNVPEFLEYGAIIHLSILGWLLCCGCCSMGPGGEMSFYAGGCAVCCGFMFFISWIVIGFLLHSEMTPDNVVNDSQCITMVHAWTIIKVIEFGGIPFLMCCGVLCISIFDDNDLGDMLEMLAVGCGYFCAGSCILGLFFGSDIAMLVIHSKFDCDSAMIGEPTYFGVETFVYAGSAGHLGVIVLGMCCTVAVPTAAMGLACYSCLFFVTWAVFGLMMWSDLDTSTAENKMCSDAILSWNILKIFEFVVLPFCAACATYFD